MEKIGIYEFDPTAKPLGRGTFGEVYLGHEIGNHTRLVAIKKTERKKTTPHCSPKTEIRILNSIRNHPNIVCYLHAQAGSCKLWQCVSSPDVYLVTEYCNGGDLSKHICKNAPLEPAVTIAFLKQIMRAMMTLDSLNIIHRDLKPSNILLNISPGSNNITLKVADFGLARILEDSATASTQCGTAAYMAPEVLEGRDYTSRADVFSVGVIAYKCLTAKQPYDKHEQFKKPEQFRAFYASIPRPVPELAYVTIII